VSRLSGVLARSDVGRARVVVDLGEAVLRVEGGARVGTPGALAPLFRNDVTAPSSADLRISELVLRRGTTDGGTLYVYAEDAVPTNATESDVRGIAAVTEGTRVHLPGTWDRRFPRADRERADEFLGTTPRSGSPGATPTTGPGTTGATATPGEAGTGSTSGGGPGFGPVAALLAVTVALLARRRVVG
jgi:hypothetical protein